MVAACVILQFPPEKRIKPSKKYSDQPEEDVDPSEEDSDPSEEDVAPSEGTVQFHLVPDKLE